MKDLQKIAFEATDLARKVILDYYASTVEVEYKGDQSPVTIADKKAEEVMREFFRKEMPECGLIGEEHGIEDADAEYVWIMDPIDGTKSFIHKVPLFGTLLALYHKGEPLMGLIDMSALGPQGSRLHAFKGEGCFLDQVPCRVSQVSRMEEACILSGTVNSFENLGREEQFKKLRHQGRLYRGWGDAFGYYQVACGRAEMMVDPVVSLWDVAPMPVIFAEAGGQFTDLTGGLSLVESLKKGIQSYATDDRTGLASNGLLHPQALESFS